MICNRWVNCSFPWVRSAAPVVALALVACSQSHPPAKMTWDPKAAAAYLDRRMEWWISWDNSARDHDTFCVSCHTAVPYALARPALRSTLSEQAPPAPERRLMEDVRRRVRLWDETGPFYSDQYVGPGKTAESRGSEAVLSALMLAWDDARTGRLSADTPAAFQHMWAEQHTSGDLHGAWSWLDFDLAPWEDANAPYYGAALAALAVGVAPDNYQSRPEIQDHLQRLRDYLVREYPVQSLHHRVILLWATTVLPGLMDAPQRQSLVSDILRAQNTDGGWSLTTLTERPNKRSLAVRNQASDGYATAVTTLVLQQSGTPEAATATQRGRAWLMRNQQGHGGVWVHGPERFWITSSLNKWRAPWTNVGRFMSDAATAYAVLALTEQPKIEPAVAAVRK